MVWYDLRVGDYKTKITPIKKDKETNYPTTDKDGNELKWVKGTNTRGYWVNDKEEKITETYKLINGKVRGKLEKTKETQNFKEVEIKEVKDLIPKLYYYVECEELKNKLTDDNAIKFAYSSGNGQRAYYSYVFKIGQAVIMVCGETYLSEQLRTIEDSKVAQKLLEELKGVTNKTKAEDILEI